jgi:preprotein translocase subunit SecB
MNTNLLNIFLVKSSFERSKNISYEENHSAESNTEIEYGISENGLLIVEFQYDLNIHITKGKKKTSLIKFSTKHVAKFDISDLDEDNEVKNKKLERFANINAAAMIFPFIRETIASTTAKAGMAPILIPVVNFVNLHEDKVKSKADNKQK